MSTQEIPYGYCHCGCGQLTSIATLTSVKHGRVKGLPVRFIIGHGGRKPAADRFWSHVKKSPESCWLWTGTKTKGGYGLFGLGGRKGGNTTAHRFSYELHYGPLSDNEEACHQCDNPSCVRPDHLFKGTHSDNMQDMLKKKRGRWDRTKPNQHQVRGYRQRP